MKIKKSITFITLLLLSFTFSACNKNEGKVKESVETQSGQEEVIEKENSPKEPQEAQSIENFEDIQEEYSDVDTSDWKTYTDESDLFSFKYPKNWEVIEAGHLFKLKEKGETFYFEGIEAYPLDISLNGECENGDKAANKLEDILFRWGQDFEIEKKRLGNFMAYEVMTHLSKNFFVSFNEEKECYLRMNWMVLGGSDLDRENEEVYKGIISTLRFFNS